MPGREEQSQEELLRSRGSLVATRLQLTVASMYSGLASDDDENTIMAGQDDTQAVQSEDQDMLNSDLHGPDAEAVEKLLNGPPRLTETLDMLKERLLGKKKVAMPGPASRATDALAGRNSVQHASGKRATKATAANQDDEDDDNGRVGSISTLTQRNKKNTSKITRQLPKEKSSSTKHYDSASDDEGQRRNTKWRTSAQQSESTSKRKTKTFLDELMAEKASKKKKTKRSTSENI